jgi:phytanoyl-CoA hydroxylase
MIHAGAISESPTDLRFVDKSKPYDDVWTFAAFSDNDPNLARKLKNVRERVLCQPSSRVCL